MHYAGLDAWILTQIVLAFEPHVEAKGMIMSDSSAAIGMVQREGLGGRKTHPGSVSLDPRASSQGRIVDAED